MRQQALRPAWRNAAVFLLVATAFVVGLLVVVAGYSGPATAGTGPQAANSRTSANSVADVNNPRPSLAVKLARGARFALDAEGCLRVIPPGDLPPRSSAEPAGGSSGVPLEVADELGSSGIYILEAPAEGSAGVGGVSLAEAALVLRSMPGVEWVEVSQPLEACLEPNDPWYVSGPSVPVGEWGFSRTRFTKAWDTTTGSSQVVVAILDTGLNADVADFAGRIVSPYSILSQSSDWPAWRDNKGHGTAVAGVAVAQGNNSLGMAGAAWNVGIMPVKISDQGDSDTNTLARAIQYAVDNGADIINVSFAGSPSNGSADPPRTLVAAVQYATDHGVPIVAAAGNSGAPTVSYPAALPAVIAVGATDMSDALLADYDCASNTGEALDLVAPGKTILSYDGQSATSFSYFKGTSLAAPFVSGLAALMLSVNSSLTPGELVDLLAAAADDLGSPGWDASFGWGIIDAAEAVQKAAAYEETTTTSTTGSQGETSTTTSSSTTTSVPSTTTTVPSTTTTVPRFADVSADTTPYYQEIEYLASLGVVTGAGGYFRPNQPLLRQQFAKMIVLALGYPVTTEDLCPFKDVPLSQGDELYPDHYIAVAYAHGIIRGVDSAHFAPFRSLTRAQLVTMVVRAAGLADPSPGYQCGLMPSQFPSLEHYRNACKAAYAGILGRLVGLDSPYDFRAPASRGEACALLYALIR